MEGNYLCTLEKNMYSTLFGQSGLQMSGRSCLYSIAWVFYFLVDFLPSCSVHYWKYDIKVSTIIVELSISPLNSQLFLPIFCSSVCRCIYIYNCYSFLINWHFYHYNLVLFIPSNIFVLKSIFFSDISITILAFWGLLFAWFIAFYPFALNLFVSLNL